MANDLGDLMIAILGADGVEQVELERPREAVPGPPAPRAGLAAAGAGGPS
jgi:hypothetical protein